jgi:hypothetical protein
MADIQPSVIQMTEDKYATCCSTAALAVQNYQQYVMSPPMSETEAAAHAIGFRLGMEVAANMILHHGNCKFEKGD